MKTLLRRALFFAFALLMAQIAFCCLFFKTAEAEKKAPNTNFLGITAKLDLQKEANYSEFYPREISVLDKGTLKGIITIQENLGGTLIPIGALSALMKWPIIIDQDNQMAEGYDPEIDQKLKFIPVIHTIMMDGHMYDLVENEMIFSGNDVYVDLNVLNKMLGMQLMLERPKGILTVGTDVTADIVLSTPPNNITGQHSTQISEKLVEAPQAIPPPSVEKWAGEGMPTAGEANRQKISSNAGISDDSEILVLRLMINTVLMTDLLDARMRDGKVFLPFCAIVEILEFPITCNLDSGAAAGWFMRQQNTLSIKLPEAIVKGSSNILKSDQYIKNDEGIYIDKKTLENWFSLAFEVNEKSMELSLTSQTPFPFEERMKREQLYAILENKRKMAEAQKKFRPYDLPYKGLSWPVTDVNLNASYDEAAAQSTTSLYNIQGAGDLGYMSMKYYLSGDLTRKVLTDSRFSIGRDDYKKELLGPLNASTFRFGDINSVGISQIAQASEGRGLMLTNRDISRSDKFDVTSFTGDSTAGWDVELYRNGTLVNTETVGSDGRYEFNDVPILFGNNEFRILLLGPQGQIEEKVKYINTDNSLIDKGDFTYNFSVDEKSRRLHEKREITPDHSTGTRVVGEVEYGISRWLTASLGASKTYIREEEYKYASAGATASFLGILASINHAAMMNDVGHSTKVVAYANYLGTNMRFSQKVANDFINEEETTLDTAVKRESTLDLDRTFVLPFLGELSTGLYLQKTRYENAIEEKLARLRMSKSFRGFNISNTLEQNTITDNERRLSGNFALRGALSRNLLSFTADYDITPQQEINNYVVGWRRNLSSNITNNFTFTHRYEAGVKNEIENALTWDLNKYKLYLTGRYDSNQNIFAGLGLNFSFGRYDNDWQFTSRDQSETGTVIAKTYFDKNYNFQKDEGEEAAENISLKIGSRFYTTDKEGKAIARNLETNSPVYIYADDRKLADKQLGKSLDGYELSLRPGIPGIIDFPIFMTAEVEGLIEFPAGIDVPKNMKITLLGENIDLLSETTVEFDGYFLFRNIMPGNYTLKIPEEIMAENNLIYSSNPEIVVGNEDDFVSAVLKLSSAETSVNN